MKTMKKVSAFLLMVVLCMSIMVMPAFATTTSQDGLEVTLTTDKETYDKGEQIEATLVVTNTNDFAVSNVSLENTIPEGYKLSEGSTATKHVESLAPGEMVSLTVTYVAVDSDNNEDKPDSGDNTGDTDKPGSGNDTDSENSSGNNESSGNDEDNPQTGDNSNIALWATLMVVAAGSIVAIVMKKKSGKKLLSLFLCATMICSLATGISFKAYAEELNINSVKIQTVISVDSENLTLNGIVSYNKLEVPSDGITLSNFMADDNYFIADFESIITFTVDVSGSTNVVNLCSDSGEVLGEMHDDGTNGDNTAQDGIYTYALTANYPAGNVEFYAKSGSATSNTETVEFFSKPTEEMRNAAEEIQQNLEGINLKYSKEDGTMPKENVDAAFNEAVEYAKSLTLDGKIINYEITNHNVVYNLVSGLTLLFAPKIEGTYSVGADTSMTIYTFQPLYDWVHGLQGTYINLPDNISNEADLIPAAANALSNEFSNCTYTSATAIKNRDITLSDIKGIGSNQIVLWQGHGSWAGDKIHSVLLTNSEFDWDAWFWNPIYFIDCCAKRIVNQNGWESVSSKYIDHYCGNMDNTYIYLGPCESGHDNVLAQSFLNKGASAVIGNTHSVLCLYGDMMEYTTTKLLAEVNPDTGNYYTLGEALSKAKTLYGNNDSRYGGEGAEPTLFGGTTAQNYRLADAKTGTLSGKVCKASDRVTPVTEATISVYKGNNLYTTLAADANGNYSVNLPAGEYRIEITANGYISFTAYASVTENNNTYTETFLMVEGSEGETGIASGNIYNALSGNGIEGVSLTIRKGWNNTGIGDVLTTITTGSNGSYSVELPLGNYTMYATKDGYISATVNIIVQEGTTSDQNGTMTPTISGDSFRIVLTWGENPRDLDSHVEGTLSDRRTFHVYYGHKSQYDGDVEACNLDVDDTSSYGPETITLNTTTDSPYYYYIYRFSGSGTVASSGAQVKVYQGENLVTTFNVPTDQGNGDYWNVFAIINGELVVQNTITSNKDTSYANTLGTYSVREFLTEDDMPDKEDSVNESTENATEDSDITGTFSVENKMTESTEEIETEVVESTEEIANASENQDDKTTYEFEIEARGNLCDDSSEVDENNINEERMLEEV